MFLCNLTSIGSLLVLLITGCQAQNVPTWPASSDDLEDLMFLQTGYRAKGFAAPVTPCSFSAQGPSRIAAAEWVRTAFHDVATANNYYGTGGLDASIAFELRSSENEGNSFITTITNQAPFFGPRVSMADVIALGMYTAVRSCGGPIIPLKYGRIDATRAGDTGVPQPQNAIGTFQNQFGRLGFNDADMVAAVACGHSIGGVHASSQPLIVPSGSVANDYAHLDTTSDRFDEKIASEYISGTTQNPLVVGIARNSGRDADNRVFRVDNNVTITKLADPVTFQNTCRLIMQRLIEIVPANVKLSAGPLVAYEVKPYNLQTYLFNGANSISFNGELRVRTTNRPAASISGVQIVYKDRNGGSSCGACTIVASKVGDAAAFDDTFSFYEFSATIPTTTSISSFSVIVTTTSGSTTFNNNGSGFAVSDALLLQLPQSCIDSSLTLTITAAVRDAGPNQPTLRTIVRTPRTGSSLNPVPVLTTTSTSMSAVANGIVGAYTLYSVSVPLDSTKAPTAKYSLILGSNSVSLQDVASLASICSPIPSASSSTSATQTTTTASISSTAFITTTNALSSSTTIITSLLTSSSNAITTSASTSSSSTPNPTPTYTYLGCYFDKVSQRTFNAKSTSSSTMDYATCASFCTPYQYFGLEYGAECWCSSMLPSKSSSTVAQDSDCNMPCAGNSGQTCGAGDRLSVFATSANVTGPSNSASINGFKFQGCMTDSQSARTLGDSRLNSGSMTLSACAQFCNGYTYFGTEYASECYCGNTLGGGSSNASVDDCNMVCSGDNTQFCGAGDRLSLYKAS